MLSQSDHMIRPSVRIETSAGIAWTPGRLRRAAMSGAAVLSLFLSIGTAATAQSSMQVKKPIEPPSGFGELCSRYDWACAGGGGSLAGAAALKIAQQVNLHVNTRVRQTTDQSQYGAGDYWALPTAKGGDCEDLVLLKKRQLAAQGIAADRLLIATVLTGARRPHAVLVLRLDEGDYVLDNLVDSVKRWDQTGYSFIRMQDPAAPQRWAALFQGGVFDG
jgi:predicted transglutaminase-like cysteine proteinase